MVETDMFLGITLGCIYGAAVCGKHFDRFRDAEEVMLSGMAQGKDSMHNKFCPEEVSQLCSLRTV